MDRDRLRVSQDLICRFSEIRILGLNDDGLGIGAPEAYNLLCASFSNGSSLHIRLLAETFFPNESFGDRMATSREIDLSRKPESWNSNSHKIDMLRS